MDKFRSRPPVVTVIFLVTFTATNEMAEPVCSKSKQECNDTPQVMSEITH